MHSAYLSARLFVFLCKKVYNILEKGCADDEDSYMVSQCEEYVFLFRDKKVGLCEEIIDLVTIIR